MRKWLLFALIGLVLLYTLSFREGVNATLSPPPSCPEGTTFDGTNCLNASNIASTPSCPAGYHYSINKCVVDTTTPDPTSYGDILQSIQDADNGALPPPIDESAATDVARQSTTGPVFASGGPFSRGPGTGQGTGASAAAGLNGNTYGNVTGSTGAFNFYPKSKGSAYSGTKLPVNGPNWGGPGSASSSTSNRSSQPAPALYGPGDGSGYRTGSESAYGTNSWDVSMLPSYQSAGSDPSIAAASRIPGDMDLYPNPYIQSTSYSLANGSQKTNPVPFLADFSAFQN
jgi:hypothetical protein